MPHTLDQILPSLQSLGVWTYWIIALFAMLEATIGAGIVAPGALVVFAGGMLAQRGVIDFFDLGWFVIAGTVLGGEISFRVGRLASRGLEGRGRFTSSRYTIRAKDLLTRYGALAMVIGRLSGPLSAFVPFSAAIAGMERRRFVIWNVISAFPYTLFHLSFGYFLGNAIGTMGAAAPRILAFGAGVVAAVAVFWFVVKRIGRSLPLLAELLHTLTVAFLAKPWVRRWTARHPKAASFVAARFETTRFAGLAGTVLIVLFVYVLGAYLDSVYDYVGSPDVTQADARLANLLYAMRDPHLVALFGWITALGGWEVVVVMLAGATAGLVLLRRYGLVAGLWITVVGNQITVTLLKSFFDRPRSVLGYFTETSGSFPSGHAASSVAIWGLLFYLAWRVRALPAVVAGLAALTLAFLIGLSRIYLVEHYLSDVLNGYLVGGLWLILGIAFCEWQRERIDDGSQGLHRPKLAAAAVILAAVTSVTLASTLSHSINPSAPTPTITGESDIAADLRSGALPGVTRTLTGAPRAPINIVVEAADAASLISAATSSGLVVADRPGLGILARAFWADWTGGTLPQPLVIPVFWGDRPNDLSFARIDAGQKDIPKLHIRFWRTHFQNAAGDTILVGSVVLEDPLEGVEDGTRAALTSSSAVTNFAAALEKAGLSVTAINVGTPDSAPGRSGQEATAPNLSDL